MEGVPCGIDDCADGYRCCSGTCIEADRCTDCVVESAGLDASPACDCDSFQPMCVGARWDYDEFDPVTNELAGSKTHVITNFGDPGEPLFNKSGFDAFAFCRSSADSLKEAWQTVDGPRTAWQMHRWLGGNRESLRTAYYLPERLRLDQGRTTPGEAWTETYTWVTILETSRDPEPCNDGSLATPLTDVTDGFECADDAEQWRVLSLTEAEAYGADLTGRAPQDVLCHLVHGSTAKVFCFVRGVGKLFELEMSAKREQLVSYDIPGCGAWP